MANLIFNVFAFKDGHTTSPQLAVNITVDDVTHIYLHNIFVSLLSAKGKNPDDDVALITNQRLPVQYEELFTAYGIQLISLSFDTFVFPKEYQWSLAFFKLAALSHFAHHSQYENLLLIDADTYTISDYTDIWLEAAYGILLYNINHRISHKDRQQILQNYQSLYHTDNYVPHFGGEFIAGNRVALQAFLDNCLTVYEKIRQEGFSISHDLSDEFILSVASTLYQKQIINAGAYIYRYWTKKAFYLCATNFINNAVTILHVPCEKKDGMLYLYKYYQRHRSFPTDAEVFELFGFPECTPSFSLKRFIAKVASKIGR